jgi:PAS domain S-box-containing protein
MDTSQARSKSSLTGWFTGPTSLNAHLVRLIVGGLGPLLIFAILMMVLFARQEAATRRRALEDTARALTLAIDQELESSIANLEALATSEPLDFGRVNVFRPIAARFLRTQSSWDSITLFDPAGKPLTTVHKAVTHEGGNISREHLAAVTRTRRAVVSDFPDPESAEKKIAIHIPVVREQTLIYVLSATIDPQTFSNILAQQKLPEAWRGALFDSRQIILARSRDSEQYIGKRVGPLLGKANLDATEQFLEGMTLTGMQAYAAISRSRQSGWFVALTMPRSEVTAGMYRSLTILAGGGVLLLLSGLFVAVVFARQVSKSIAGLSAVAHSLGRGQPVPPAVHSPIAELDGLAREIERAAELLREREYQRDRVETELRKQESFLQRQADLLDLANEAIFATEIDGRIIYWNRGAEQLYGYTRSEALGGVGHDLLATDFPDGRQTFMAHLMERREWTGELKQQTKSGRRIDVESRFRLIDDRAGGSLMLECNRDVTHRKQTARRLSTEHAVTVALAESETPEAAWRKILPVIGEGLGWEVGLLWIVNKPRQWIQCVETWHKASGVGAGCEEQAPLGRGADLVGRVWANEKPIWITDIRNATDVSVPAFPGVDNLRSALALPIKMRNEILGVLEFFGVAVWEPDDDLLKTVEAIGGEIGQFVERMRAEAALRQSEESLRNQAQELEQQLLASGRLVAVGELTASMAHEFNNPLGIIMGFAQGLLADMNPDDAHYNHVQIIAEEAKRCERLVQELLEFGRPKNAEFAPTDVEEIIRRTSDLVQNHAAKNHVKTVLQFDGDGKLPRIHADAQQLQQVLLNLSLNAVDAMPKGGTLTVGAAIGDGNQMTLSVADDGIGIDADVLPKIFQPFFTSKKRRGLGLGLPICARIVKAHGGRIEVSSRPGQGTLFRIILPVATVSTP